MTPDVGVTSGEGEGDGVTPDVDDGDGDGVTSGEGDGVDVSVGVTSDVEVAIGDGVEVSVCTTVDVTTMHEFLQSNITSSVCVGTTVVVSDCAGTIGFGVDKACTLKVTPTVMDACDP